MGPGLHGPVRRFFPGFPSSLDFLDFWPHNAVKAPEMRGTLQKQQNRPLPNVRSFSGSYFQGPLDFLDFRPPKAAEMRGDREQLHSRQNEVFLAIDHISLKFHITSQGNASFPVGSKASPSCKQQGRSVPEPPASYDLQSKCLKFTARCFATQDCPVAHMAGTKCRRVTMPPRR